MRLQGCFIQGNVIPANVYQGLYQGAGTLQQLEAALPDIRSIASCAFLDDAFIDIVNENCGPTDDALRRATIAALLTAAVATIAGLLFCFCTQARRPVLKTASANSLPSRQLPDGWEREGGGGLRLREAVPKVWHHERLGSSSRLSHGVGAHASVPPAFAFLRSLGVSSIAPAPGRHRRRVQNIRRQNADEGRHDSHSGRHEDDRFATADPLGPPPPRKY